MLRTSQRVKRSLFSIFAVSVSILTWNGIAKGQNTESGKTATSSNTTALTLMRKPANDGVVIGVLKVRGYTFYTLEDEAHLIPKGNYRLSIYKSPKFKVRVIRVEGVFNRADIEIHPGNFKKDSQGCLLIGLSHTDRSVVASQAALRRLLPLLTESSFLTIT